MAIFESLLLFFEVFILIFNEKDYLVGDGSALEFPGYFSKNLEGTIVKILKIQIRKIWNFWTLPSPTSPQKMFYFRKLEKNVE
jgi:hypothetical protein